MQPDASPLAALRISSRAPEGQKLLLAQGIALGIVVSRYTGPVRAKAFFGAQVDRHRYASFLATTNNPRPLNDPTGSRRFICVRIPEGVLIDNETPIDYEQLYAQLVDEVENRNLRWWFTQQETIAIQEANLPFQHIYSVHEMVNSCFRRPRFGEQGEFMGIDQLVEGMQDSYPEMEVSTNMRVQIGATMKRLGFEHQHRKTGNFYKVVPRQVLLSA